jgi:hypothetical protein
MRTPSVKHSRCFWSTPTQQLWYVGESSWIRLSIEIKVRTISIHGLGIAGQRIFTMDQVLARGRDGRLAWHFLLKAGKKISQGPNNTKVPVPWYPAPTKII